MHLYYFLEFTPAENVELIIKVLIFRNTHETISSFLSLCINLVIYLWDSLLEAYFLEFTPEENVELIIKVCECISIYVETPMQHYPAGYIYVYVYVYVYL